MMTVIDMTSGEVIFCTHTGSQSEDSADSRHQDALFTPSLALQEALPEPAPGPMQPALTGLLATAALAEFK